MRTAVVVGGAGFLGGAVVEAILRRRDTRAVVVDYLENPERAFLDPRVEFLRLDAGNEMTSRFERVIAGADEVYWLAAVVGEDAFALAEARVPDWVDRLHRVNPVLAAEIGRGTFIFTSSASVYGRTGAEGAVKPIGRYAEAKAAVEEKILDRGGIVLRLGTLGGVSPYRFRTDLLLNTMICRGARTGRITVQGPELRRPVLDVRDAGEALVGIATAARFPEVMKVETFTMPKNLFAEVVSLGYVAAVAEEALAAIGVHVQLEAIPAAGDGRDYAPGEAVERRLWGLPRVRSLPETAKDVVHAILHRNALAERWGSNADGWRVIDDGGNNTE